MVKGSLVYMHFCPFSLKNGQFGYTPNLVLACGGTWLFRAENTFSAHFCFALRFFSNVHLSLCHSLGLSAGGCQAASPPLPCVAQSKIPPISRNTFPIYSQHRQNYLNHYFGAEVGERLPRHFPEPFPVRKYGTFTYCKDTQS